MPGLQYIESGNKNAVVMHVSIGVFRWTVPMILTFNWSGLSTGDHNWWRILEPQADQWPKTEKKEKKIPHGFIPGWDL